ncbi:MAG: TSUP family transporter [Magnetococcales bacterium]|nr:TSUP family transporter [Magnetococcales bacterium]NGZ26848.1 TSUP family transporter [Magnetococcales bacterium]
MKFRRPETINNPFCKRRWKLPAVVLIVAYVVTFAWGIHLWREMSATVPVVAVAAPKQDIPEWMDQAPDPAGEVLPMAGVMPTLGGSLNASEQNAVVNIAGSNRNTDATQSGGAFVSGGTGVLISPDGHVITAWHAIKDLRDLQVRVLTPAGPRHYHAELIKKSKRYDLAMLKVISRDSFPFLMLDTPGGVDMGSRVNLLGNPRGNGLNVSVGMLTGTTSALTIENQLINGLLRVDGLSSDTHSGSPLVSERGRLVGLHLTMLEGYSGLAGYAVPSKVIFDQFRDVVNFPKDSALTAVAVPQQVAMQQPMPSTRQRPMAEEWWRQAQTRVSGEDAAERGASVSGGAVALQAAAVSPLVNDTSSRDDGHLLEYDFETIAGLLLLGIISGISGGMMTMGGGIIKVSGLVLLFGYGMVLVRPVAYLTNIFLYGAATLRYRKAKLITFDVVRPLLPWAMVGMVLGFFAGIFMGNTLIRYLLGVFAVLVGLKMLAEILEQQRYGQVDCEDHHLDGEQPIQADITEVFLRYLGVRDLPGHQRAKPLHPLVQNGLLGLPLGVISGILGITGGVVEVPLQRYVAGVPLRNAIANSAILVFAASTVGSLVAMFYGVQTGAFDWKVPVTLSLFLIPGAYLGGWIGAWLTQVVPLTMLRWLYALLMFIIAARMFWE